MREVIISEREEGQRLDRYLEKYMPDAPKSFFYKMMRKKNITLNGKKCEGGEMLAEGDTVKLFLADETIEKFSEIKVQKIQKEKKVQLSILYEDEDILLINKPAGMLSQKARDTDLSLVEYLTDYLMEKGSVTEGSLRSFKPSVCNRLDRNTSGILAVGKSVDGVALDAMKEMLDEECELVTIYYGADVSEHEAKVLEEQAQEQYPDKEIELQYGGQPIYYYMISAE